MQLFRSKQDSSSDTFTPNETKSYFKNEASKVYRRKRENQDPSIPKVDLSGALPSGSNGGVSGGAPLDMQDANQDDSSDLRSNATKSVVQGLQEWVNSTQAHLNAHCKCAMDDCDYTHAWGDCKLEESKQRELIAKSYAGISYSQLKNVTEALTNCEAKLLAYQKFERHLFIGIVSLLEYVAEWMRALVLMPEALRRHNSESSSINQTSGSFSSSSMSEGPPLYQMFKANQRSIALLIQLENRLVEFVMMHDANFPIKSSDCESSDIDDMTCLNNPNFHGFVAKLSASFNGGEGQSLSLPIVSDYVRLVRLRVHLIQLDIHLQLCRRRSKSTPPSSLSYGNNTKMLLGLFKGLNLSVPQSSGEVDCSINTATTLTSSSCQNLRMEDSLRQILVELYALCVADALLAGCSLSPLTGDKVIPELSKRSSGSSGGRHKRRKDKGLKGNANDIIFPPKSEVETVTDAMEESLSSSDFCSDGSSSVTTPVEDHKYERATLKLILLLMELLDQVASPSSVRAKLSYSAGKFYDFFVNGDLASLFTSTDEGRSIQSAIHSAFANVRVGSADKHRTSQVLYFESAVDIFSTPLFSEESGRPSPKNVPSYSNSSSFDLIPTFSVEQTITGNAKPTTYLSGKVLSLSLDISKWFSLEAISSSGSASSQQQQQQPLLTEFGMIPQSNLDLFGISVLISLFDVFSSVKKSLQLQLLQLQLRLLSIRGPSTALHALRKKVGLLALESGNKMVAIESFKCVLGELSPDDIDEVAFITDLLATEYMEMAEFEEAVGILTRTIKEVTDNAKQYEKNKVKILKAQVCLDPLQLKLARVWLDIGCPDKAALEIQQLLMSLNARPNTPMNLGKKITALSWLLQAYLEMDCPDICKKIIVAIKCVRSMTAVSLNSAGDGNTTSNNSASNSSNRSGGSNKGGSGQSSVSKGDHIGTIFTKGGEEGSTGGGSTSGNSGNLSSSKFHLSLEDNLPRYCLSSHHADLGEAMSRVYFQSNLYVSALKSLTPTIIGVELTVGHDSTRPREGLLELARLYYLRGKIQFEASKMTSKVKFPFIVGSAQLFTAVYMLFDSDDAAKQQKQKQRRYGDSTAGSFDPSFRGGGYSVASGGQKTSLGSRDTSIDRDSPVIILTCKRAKRFSSPSDLLWDAMKWFRRAWDIFHGIGDAFRAAKAANYIAKSQLEPTFVPFIFFKVPLSTSTLLGSFRMESSYSHGSNSLDDNSSNNTAGGRKSFDSTKDSKEISGSFGFPNFNDRQVSLLEVQNVMSFSLDISVECCQPLLLIDNYLNMAELRILEGEPMAGIAFWCEARELFVHLFSDGSLVPLLRVGTMHFLRKLKAILDRMVRFLLSCDRHVINQNLLILDMQTIFSHEFERAERQIANNARKVSQKLDNILNSLTINLTSSPSQVHADQQNTSISSTTKTKGSFPTFSSIQSVASTASISTISSTGAHGSTVSHRGVGGYFYDVDTESVYESDSGDATNPNIFIHVREKVVSFERTGIDSHDEAMEESYDRLSFIGNVPQSFNSSGHSNTDNMSKLVMDSMYRWAATPPLWLSPRRDASIPSTSSFGILSSHEEAESVLILNAWRAVRLLTYVQNRKDTTLADMRTQTRKALCTLSFTMKRLRAFSNQITSKDLAFDELLRMSNSSISTINIKAEGVPDIISGRHAVEPRERLCSTVYVIYIGRLLFYIDREPVKFTCNYLAAPSLYPTTMQPVIWTRLKIPTI